MYILVLFFVLLCSSPLFSQGRYMLDEYAPQPAYGGIQVLNANGNTFFSAGLSPDFKYKKLHVGADLFFYVPQNKTKDSSLDFIALRYVGYEFDKHNSFTFGPQYDVSLGQGLLMDHYNSAIGGNIQYRTQKGAFVGKFRQGPYDAKALWSLSNIKGGHLRYTFSRSPFFGSPLSLGGTYITDQDGVDYELDDSHRVFRPSMKAYAFDIGLPVGGDFLTLYSEYAKLDQFGSGVSFGIRGDFYSYFEYRAEYRHLNKSFVPSYFNSVYEATSFSESEIKATPATSGYLVGASAQLLDNYVKLGAQYESYKNNNTFMASMGFRPIGPLAGVINYTVPFQGDQNRVLEADLYLKTGLTFDYVLRFKRIYDDTKNQYTDSYAFGAQMGFDKLWPF